MEAVYWFRRAVFSVLGMVSFESQEWSASFASATPSIAFQALKSASLAEAIRINLVPLDGHGGFGLYPSSPFGEDMIRGIGGCLWFLLLAFRRRLTRHIFFDYQPL